MSYSSFFLFAFFFGGGIIPVRKTCVYELSAWKKSERNYFQEEHTIAICICFVIVEEYLIPIGGVNGIETPIRGTYFFV